MCNCKLPFVLKRALYFFGVGALIATVLFGILLYKYPYSVRYAIAKFIPSVKVSYSAKDLNYLDTFNDQQQRQLRTAKAVGLQEVPSSRKALSGMLNQLETIKNCRAYTLAPMGHSAPYLRPNAKTALEQIGTAFRDSLKSKGLPDYKIVVTSLLRTQDDVDLLQKTNSIATTNSCHCYGTTFDISYVRFDRVVIGKSMSAEDLKKILGEVLLEQKKAGNIYVKHEISQPCFHITSKE